MTTSQKSALSSAREAGERPGAGRPIRVESGGRAPSALFELAEDAGQADGRVLEIGPGLAFEAQGVVEVEDDQGVLRVLEHEIAERAAGDGGAIRRLLRGAEVGIPLVDLGQGFGLERSSRSSALTPSPLRPETSTNALPSSPGAASRPSSLRLRGERATIS